MRNCLKVFVRSIQCPSSNWPRTCVAIQICRKHSIYAYVKVFIVVLFISARLLFAKSSSLTTNSSAKRCLPIRKKRKMTHRTNLSTVQIDPDEKELLFLITINRTKMPKWRDFIHYGHWSRRWRMSIQWCSYWILKFWSFAKICYLVLCMLFGTVPPIHANCPTFLKNREKIYCVSSKRWHL